MNDRLLVVGGTGFIGRNLVLRALKYDFNIVVLSLHKPSNEKMIEGVDYIQMDLSQSSMCNKDMLGGPFDYVVNLLGYVNHDKFLEGGRKVIQDHFEGLLNLLQLLEWSELKKFIQIGSSDEYGNNPAPQKENMRESPISSYSLSKVSCSHFLQMLHRTEEFPVVIFRLFLTYGPEQDNKRFIPQVIKGLMSDAGFPTSMGHQLRDFCYVDDIVEGILESFTNNKINGEVINLASGSPVKVDYIIKLIQKKLGKGNPQFGGLLYRKGENMELYADISKANSILNWKPTTPLEDGIDKTIEFYLTQLS